MLKHQERNSNSEIIVNMFQWDLAQGDFLNREQHQKNELKQESQRSMNSSASQFLISRSCMSRRNIETNAHILQCPGSLSWGGGRREDNCTASCFLFPVPDNDFNFSTRGSLNCHGSLNHIVFSVSLIEKRDSWKEKKKIKRFSSILSCFSLSPPSCPASLCETKTEWLLPHSVFPYDHEPIKLPSH